MREASPVDLGVIKDTKMKDSMSSVAARLRAGAVWLITETYIQIESKLCCTLASPGIFKKS